MSEAFQIITFLIFFIILPSVFMIVSYALILESISKRTERHSLGLSLATNLLVGTIGLMLAYSQLNISIPYLVVWISIPIGFWLLKSIQKIRQLANKR